MPKILVTCREMPDLDGAACAYAYAEFLNKIGKESVAGLIGKMHKEAAYVFIRFKIKPPEDASKYIKEKVVLVDSSELAGVAPMINPKRVIEIIDHRKSNEIDKFPNAKAQIELVGSAATLIAEKFYKKKIDISNESAALLYSAIVSNTINFNGIVTDKDKKMAEWLLKKLTLPKNYVHDMFVYKSNFDTSLKDAMKNDTKNYFFNKSIRICQLEIVNADEFIDKNEKEIKKILSELKGDMDFIFLTVIDVEKGYNIFVTVDKESQVVFEKSIGVKFSNGIAKNNKVIMRKEIIPLIKEMF